MTKDKLNILLSTINFSLVFIGYQIVTTLFLPVSSDVEEISRQITIPYRGLSLLLSLSVILINIKNINKTFSLPLKAFLLYWGLLIVRIFYDTNLRSDVRLEDVSQLWLYIFGIILPNVFAIIKSYKFIDLKIALNLIFISCGVILLITLFSNQVLFMGEIEEGRQNANVALNTISFGYVGVTTILIGMFIITRKENIFIKILIFTIILLGFYSMLRAGSRGPFLSLIIVLTFWYFSKDKYVFKKILFFAFIFLLLIIFVDSFLHLLGYISPIMEERVRLTIFEGDSSERDPLYIGAITHFINSPIFGSQFALFESIGVYDGNGTFIYSHNIILDAFMGMGIIGGFLIIYFLYYSLKISHSNINLKNDNFWISLILVQQISSDMLSSAFYYDPLLSALLVFHFLCYNSKKKDELSFN